MSEREKKLLIIFGAGLFLIANFFGFNFLVEETRNADTDKTKATNDLSEAKAYSDLYQSHVDEKEWLEHHTPEPKAQQAVETELVRYMSDFARSSQLTVKPQGQKVLKAEAGKTFTRARAEFKVSGTEANLYRWLHQMQTPDQLRGVTHFVISPQKDDDTQVDCTVTVDQWFIPLGDDAVVSPSNEATPPSEEAPGEKPPESPQPGAEESPDPGADPGNNPTPNGQ